MRCRVQSGLLPLAAQGALVRRVGDYGFRRQAGGRRVEAKEAVGRRKCLSRRSDGSDGVER